MLEGGSNPGAATAQRVSSPPTMRDVAKVAGVDRSTVSRVFNAAPSRVPIAAETRVRVMEAARQLGYRPNPLARGLAGAPTMLIGAVMRDFSDPFFADAIEALAGEAVDHGYRIVVGGQGRWQEGLSLDMVLETRYCDALIIVGDLQDQPRLLADLGVSSLPVVALWQGVSPLEFPSVDVDNRAGTMIGLRHLVDLGHERIAFVSARLPGDNWQREQAYLEFMAERFGSVRQDYVQRVPNTLAGGETALRELLALPEPPTALATSTDLTAVGVLHAAHAAGRMVPAELSVIGWDDLTISAYTVPALTTLRMPTHEIVAAGVRRAVELAQHPSLSREPSIEYFEPMLVVRNSTAAPGAAGRATAASRAGRRSGPSKQGQLSPAPEPGQVAFAIAVDPYQAVGGALQPGARVSVVAVPNANKTAAGGAPVPASVVLGTDLAILALRTPDGLPFQGSGASADLPSPLGSVVLSIPADRLSEFASAAQTSTFYLGLSEAGA